MRSQSKGHDPVLIRIKIFAFLIEYDTIKDTLAETIVMR